MQRGSLYPIHALQIAAVDMAWADSLQFEELVMVRDEEDRQTFMVVACPLRLPRGPDLSSIRLQCFELESARIVQVGWVGT